MELENDLNKKQDSAVKNKLQKSAHVVGDLIERVGQKLQEKGFTNSGAKIYEAGNKIEHMAD